MSGHYSFAEMVPPRSGHLRAQSMNYVDGYILALEDVLKDLKDLQARERTPGTDALLLEQRVARNGAYGSVRAIVNRSLANARDTMTMLKASRPTFMGTEAANERIDQLQGWIEEPGERP